MRSSTCWSSMAALLPSRRGFDNLKADPGFLQALEQGVAHRRRGGQLAGALRQLVEGEAEAGLGQHLRGLAVAGVAAAYLGDDARPAALADEDDLEPALLAFLRARSLAGGFHLQQELPGRRKLRQDEAGADPGGEAGDRRQVLGDHVVAVGEVGA